MMESTSITFSIITPTLNRDGRYQKRNSLVRCAESVNNQTYPKKLYEHILVDDGNPIPLLNNAHLLYKDTEMDFKVVRHEEQMERLISYNDGMKVSKNDWICFLDDDDEYIPFYLEYLAEAIKKFPEYKVFNFGGLVTNKFGPWIRAREVVRFEEMVGAPVTSGQIVNGQFIFHRSCLEKVGYFPETKNCYEFADLAGIPGYSSKTRTLGNPFGNDFYLFYKLTRHFISKPLDLYLYICHLRDSE